MNNGFAHSSDKYWNIMDKLGLQVGFIYLALPGLIPGLHQANERRRYKVTPSIVGWAQT